MQALIDALLSKMGDPRAGLPEALFLLVSRLTPLVNVDLLIQNEAGQTLLTWRDDAFYGPGWHVPGGIIRFKESATTRISQVAMLELGVGVEAELEPIAVSEIMSTERDVRGHFISLLYRCRLTSELDFQQQAGAQPSAGQWRWHDGFPEDMIPQHACYRAFLARRSRSL